MTEGNDWQRFGSQIKQDTKKTLDKYAQDYGLEIRQVVDEALKFFFKMSGYGAGGYSVQRQKEAAEDFNTLEDLPAPSLTCQERDLYSLFVRGGLEDQPEIKRLVQHGDTVAARRAILGGENNGNLSR